MNLLLAFTQLLLIIIIILIEYKNGSIVIFLWATLLVMFGIPHFMAVLTQTLIYPEYVYFQASLFVILFNILYLMFRYVFKVSFKINNTIKSIKTEIINRNILSYEMKLSNRLLITLLLFFLISIIAMVQSYGSIKNTSWGELYSNSLNAYSLGLNLNSISFFTNYVLFAIGGLFILFFFEKKKLKLAIVAGIIILSTIITRNRILILPIIVSIILIYLIKNRRLNFRKILMLSLIGLFVIYIVYALRLFRHYGDISTFLNTFNFISFNERLFEMLLNGDGELGLRNVFLYFIYYDNNFVDFNQGHTYLRLLLMFIPTEFSFGLKPSDFAISMGSAYSGNLYNTTYSTHPTLYGDSFANLYWFGILLGIFWALFASVIDKFIDKKSLIIKINLMVIFGSAYIIVGRGSVYNGLYIAFLASLILLVLYSIFKRLPIIKK